MNKTHNSTNHILSGFPTLNVPARFDHNLSAHDVIRMWNEGFNFCYHNPTSPSHGAFRNKSNFPNQSVNLLYRARRYMTTIKASSYRNM